MFYHMMIDCMREKEMQDFHLILSMSKIFDREQFGEIPENISIYEWVPQIEMLKKASIAIFHAGLGSVKECIFYGVPMIVFPMMTDQGDNAERIEHHRLGLSAAIEDTSAAKLCEMILQIKESEEVKKGMDEMKAIFRRQEITQNGVKFMRKFIGPPVDEVRNNKWREGAQFI